MAYTPTTGSDDPTVYTHLNGLEVLNNLIVDGNLTVKGVINNSETATNLNTVGAATITAAMITASQNIIRGGAQAGAAFTDTTDTAALIVASIAQAVVGDSFTFVYVNNTNAAATLVGGTGVNSGGTIAVIPPGSQIEFLVVLTSLTAVTFTVLIDGSATAFQPENTVALTTVGAGTITAAGITNGVTLRSGSVSAFTDTTDTAANIIAARAQVFIGSTWEYTYQNNTIAVATLTGGIGVTVSGFTVIPANAQVKYLVKYTAAATITMVGIESSAMAADATDATKVVGFKPSGQATATTALIATNNQANATYTLPPSTGAIAATSGANLLITDVYRSSAAITANATVTPATITGLAGAIAVGTYRFRAVLPSTVASGTGGIAYNFLLTTAVLSSIQYGATMKTASALQYTQGTTATSGTVVATQAAVVLETIIEGTMVVSTAGTFTLQMAQNTSNASNSVTLIGSSLELTRIA